jgi:hypothetical protein
MELSLFSKYQLANNLVDESVKRLTEKQIEEQAKKKIIDDFVTKLKEERGNQTHYVDKQGKKKKLADITFMSVKMRLIAIKEVSQLNAFYSDCLSHTDFKSFTQYYLTKTKCPVLQRKA